MKKTILTVLCISILNTTIALCQPNVYTVKRVIDGDTIVLDNNERVRLIGVDTPETVHPRKPVEYYGKEASAFTKRMCQGKKVRLEYDWQEKDKYGRTLAYVYLMNGTLVNAEIIKRGYGFAYTKFPFKYLDEFSEYERQARQKGRGLWKRSIKTLHIVPIKQKTHKVDKEDTSVKPLGYVENQKPLGYIEKE